MMKLIELILPLITKLLGKWLNDYINQGELEKLAKQKYLGYIKDLEPHLNMAVEIHDSATVQYNELQEQWRKENENTTHIIIP